MTGPRPPVLALRLLGRLLPPAAAEAIAGDLIEEFGRRAQAGGARRARRWFWRETLRSLASRGRPSAGPTGPGPDGPGRRHGAELEKAGVMSGLLQDVRFAARVLMKSPGFAATAIATLAIGVAGATTILTAAGWVWLRPLPFVEPDRLMHVGEPDEAGGVGNVGFETLLDWRSRLSSVEDIVPIRSWTVTLSGEAGAERLLGLRVGWQYFRMLGVRPALGRDFTAGDDRPDQWRKVLLSHELWRQRFGADPAVVGRFIPLFGRDYEVIGVLPADFEPLVSERFYERAQVWAPLGYAAGESSACRTCRHLRAIARLAPGATATSATAELAAVHASLRADSPDDYREEAPVMRRLDAQLSGRFEQPFRILMAAVGFLLLIACANVAGLLMTRAVDRRREIGIRAALGAGRLRIVRQLLVESVLLAGIATGVGVGLARVGLNVLAETAPAAMQRLDRASSDPTVWLVAVAVGALALIAFGLLPALEASRADLQATLRDGRHSAGRRAAGLRETMIVGQVAVALVLVIASGLMFRTVNRLLSVDPGFDPRGVLTAQFSLVGARWAEDSAVYAFQRDLEARVEALPGVEAAGLTGLLPLGGSYDRRGFGVEGQSYATPDDVPRAERYSVSPGYFETMRIDAKRGRLIDERDTGSSEGVALVNDAAVRTYWNGENPVGQRIRFGSSDDSPWVTVVGVVGDVRHYDLETPPIPQVYVPQSQSTDSYLALVVRTPQEIAGLRDQIRREVAALANDVPVYDIVAFEDLQTAAAGTRVFMMNLLGLFAVASVVLATVGLYGVLSQAVLGREREIGIRLSLGARRAEIAGLILRRGLVLVSVGLVVGLGLGAAVSGLLESQLFQVAALDPLTYATAAAGLFAASLAAHALPLRRALGVDPTLILRGD